MGIGRKRCATAVAAEAAPRAGRWGGFGWQAAVVKA
jgi:hypothetical protein